MRAKIAWGALALLVGTATPLLDGEWLRAAQADGRDGPAGRFETYLVQSRDGRLGWAVLDDREAGFRCIAPNSPGAGIACYSLTPGAGVAQAQAEALRRLP